ncbi:hypothetical protein AB0D08_40655 [Kitasatospora sp. NPDC048540]|nr:hypothetical protein [Kitasatospora sp. MBT63]
MAGRSALIRLDLGRRDLELPPPVVRRRQLQGGSLAGIQDGA